MPNHASTVECRIDTGKGLRPEEIESARVEIRERLRLRRLDIDIAPLTDLSRYTEGSILWAEQQIPTLVSRTAFIRQSEGIAIAEAISGVLDKQATKALDPYLNWSRLNCHGLLHFMADEFEEAFTRLSAAFTVANKAQAAEWISTTMLNLAKVAVGLDNVVDGARMLAQVVQVDHSDYLYSSAMNQLADLFDDHGQRSHAISYRRAAFERCQEGRPSGIMWVIAPLILNLIESGFHQEAADHLAALKELAKATGFNIYQVLAMYLDALLILRIGCHEEALASLHLAQAAEPFPNHTIYSICTPAIEAEILLANSQAKQTVALVTNELKQSTSTSSRRRLKPLGAKAAELLEDWPLVTRLRQELLDEMSGRHANALALLDMHRAHIDATAVAALNAELTKVQQQLEQTRAERDDVLDIVSHDVMSPLTTLRLLLHQLTQFPITASMQLGVDNTLDRLGNILSQLSLLDPAGPVHASAPPISLGQLLRQSSQEYHWLAAEKNIDLTLRTGEGADLTTVQQPTVLRHVIDNLLSNAIKFSEPDGPVTLTASYANCALSDYTPAAYAAAPTGHWCVVVADQGPGLDQTDLGRVFSKFGRLSAKPTAGEPTTGLGLFIASKLANSIGADLSAESAGKGEGSQFRLCLRG